MRCLVVLSAILAVSMAAPMPDAEFDMNNKEYHHKDTWNGKPSRPSDWTKPSRPENDLNLPDFINNLWNNNGPQVQPVRPWERPQVNPVVPALPNQPWPIAPLPENIERPGRPSQPPRPEFVSIQILRELFQQWLTALRDLKTNNNANVPARPLPIQPVRPYAGGEATVY
jgi:hypothetical protein